MKRSTRPTKKNGQLAKSLHGKATQHNTHFPVHTHAMDRPAVATSFAGVYPDEAIPAMAARYERLCATFTARFGCTPQYFARAPGRVNLIGEHIDYSGYGVLPMALESQDTVLAVAAHRLEADPVAVDSKDCITLANVDPDRFEEHSLALSSGERPGRKEHTWASYFQAAYAGVTERSDASSGPTKHLQICVSGNVPVASGLSSSSALVCASALAVGHAKDLPISKADYAELCCRCERYIGMESGGMDQAISFLSEQGTAKLIEFDPVRGSDVPLPRSARIVICNSGVEANKYSSADTGYNLRVVECRMAAAVLAKGLGMRGWEGVTRLKQVQDLSRLSFAELGAKAEKLLRDAPYRLSDITAALDMGEEEVAVKYTTTATRHLADPPSGLRLKERALHVFSEADRVFRFREECQRGDADGRELLTHLGELMSASHASCRDLFDCSCSELDALVSACVGAGAAGARLTGAGWGGWVVALVSSDRLQAFLEALESGYYATAAPMHHRLLTSNPGCGACVLLAAK